MKKKNNKNKLNKRIKRLMLVIPVILILIAGSIFAFMLTGPNNKEKEVTINPGSLVDIGKTLEAQGVIRSHKAFNVYAFFVSNKNLKAGTYKIEKHMGIVRIVKLLQKGSNYNPDTLKLTFKEGINIRGIAKLIDKETDNSYDEVLDIINDKEYVKTLINKYWFLEDVVLNDSIYYPLEGYLFPDTYYFKNKEVEITTIIETLLAETERKLSTFKEKILNSNYSVHEILTLASIIELEGKTTADRKDIAGVFYNRLNKKWTLGSDVTTYYAFKIDDWEEGVTTTQLNDCTTKYNTRCNTFTGLPVGPISNPSLSSIEATINPNVSDYLYFVADCNGKIYLNKTDFGHINTVNKLKKENNWCA